MWLQNSHFIPTHWAIPQIYHSVFVPVYVHMCVGRCMCVWVHVHVEARGQHGIISIALQLLAVGRVSHWTWTWLIQPAQQAWRPFWFCLPRAEVTRPYLAFAWLLGMAGRSLCLCRVVITSLDGPSLSPLVSESLSDVLRVDVQQINLLHH